MSIRIIVHEHCVSASAWWELTTPATLRRRAVDSLAFVRQRYGLDVSPGQSCTALGLPGVVTGGDGKYICVRLYRHQHDANYHARDVVLEGAP